MVVKNYHTTSRNKRNKGYLKVVLGLLFSTDDFHNRTGKHPSKVTHEEREKSGYTIGNDVGNKIISTLKYEKNDTNHDVDKDQ